MKRMLLAGVIVSLLQAAPLAWAAESGANKAPAATHGATANINMKALHRLDFKVTGTSCPACLMKMQHRIDAGFGVAKAAIMLRKPFGGVVIYDSTKTSQEKLFVVLKGDEKKVGFDKVEDAAIDKMPVILVPHCSFMNSNERS